jgi:ABC-type polysaccharide/polyol phosphate export permease
MSVGERLHELVRYRELLYNLTLRDLKLKYKGSVFGVAWSLLNPLLMMAIYTVVFSLFLRAVTVPHYWALVLGGLLAWTFFSSSLSSATAAFVRNPNLITKVYFPIEALPISQVLAHGVNFVIMLAILLALLLVAGIHLGASLVLLPVLLLALLALSLGLALVVASVTVHLRDVEHFTTLGLTALFYLTPVLYPLDPRALPKAAAPYIGYLKLNPLAWYLDSFHRVLFYGTWPDPLLFGLMLGSAVVALAGGYALFAHLRPRIPEAL